MDPPVIETGASPQDDLRNKFKNADLKSILTPAPEIQDKKAAPRYNIQTPVDQIRALLILDGLKQG